MPLFLALLAAGIALLAGTSAGAESAASLRSKADALRAENLSLDAQARQGLLELYALQSKLRRSAQRLVGLRAQARTLAARERQAARALELARESEAHAQRALQDRVRALYMEGDTDPLAVILGASSLDDLISAIDSVNRVANHDRDIIERLHATQRDLRGALASLHARQAELAALTRRAVQARASLEQAARAKADYLDQLVARKQLNASQIARLIEAAAQAEQKAEAITESAQSQSPAATSADTNAAGPAPASVGADESAAPGRQVTVAATMYCLKGTTATGIPVAPGVVATDPAYIPLGTRMYIPGYGPGVAADTGGAVIGWTIDLWVADCSQADSYGRQSITMTIYD